MISKRNLNEPKKHKEANKSVNDGVEASFKAFDTSLNNQEKKYNKIVLTFIKGNVQILHNAGSLDWLIEEKTKFVCVSIPSI